MYRENSFEAMRTMVIYWKFYSSEACAVLHGLKLSRLIEQGRVHQKDWQNKKYQTDTSHKTESIAVSIKELDLQSQVWHQSK